MRLIISPGARRDLRKVPRDMSDRVAAAIRRLAEDPRPPGCLLLRDHEPPTWRVRVGDWRLLYEIDDAAGTLTITGVHRRDQAY